MQSVLIKTIPGYEFWTDGKIWDEKKQKFIDGSTDKKGYNVVCINGKHIRRHRLMALTFMRKPEHLKDVPIELIDAHHISGDKNDNSIRNLEFVCHKKHKTMHGTKRVYQYGLDGSFIAEYQSQRDAERQTGICQTNISKCCLGKGYRIVGGYQWRSFKTDRIPPCQPKSERMRKSHSI